MKYKRILGSSYPCIYDSWTTDTAAWFIQDLRPEDDEEAVDILVENLCTDETLCSIQKLADDPQSIQDLRQIWRESLQQRMSLGCYEVKDGQETLVALNVCVAIEAGGDHDLQAKGENWKNVCNAFQYIKKKVDPYKATGLDLLLQAMGLVVKREYRGAKLGRRLLAAREPLCKSQGIKGTATVFTGAASQKLAVSCGFQTITEVTMPELADHGMPYPRDDPRIIKFMIKKYS